MDERNNYHLVGRNEGRRGGVFQGISADTKEPVFGGANIIYAPVYWNKSREDIEEILSYFRKRFSRCEFTAKKIGSCEE